MSDASSAMPTIDDYRTALQRCVAEKAADWRAACESAEIASAEIARLRLTDAEREAVEWASKTLCVGWHDLDADGKQRSRKASATLRAFLERVK